MSDLNKYLNKGVMASVAGAPQPIEATLTAIDELGIWITAERLVANILQVQPRIPIDPAILFVPYQSLNWLMAADQHQS